MKILKFISISLASLLILFTGLFYFSTYHPSQIEEVEFFNTEDAPLLKKGQKCKILTWNLQYMAGKNYVFYYDEWDGSGPDIRPSKDDITKTFERTAEIIKKENPDIILLQEMDEDNYRTDFEDQTKRLLKMISPEYKSYTIAWYWRASFVPHPKIMDKVGVRLAIISKYRISKSIRHQLPLMPNNIIIRNLQFKRAILEASFPIDGSDTPFIAMSTHLDAFAQGSDTMQKQVNYVKKILSEFNSQNYQWIIGGDFNLLPPGNSYNRLPEDEKQYFQKQSEMSELYNNFNVIPTVEEIDKDPSTWYTHFANYNSNPDRTIDFLILSNNLQYDKYYVRNKDTLDISDHMPVILEFTIK